MEKVLTISIAAYNVERYLYTTLKSLIVPEIIDDIEVLVCDDGGTDRSIEIAKEFEKKYPTSIHVIHKENGGYGSVFNHNISLASGKYFKLLDGDDWFDENALIKVVNELKKVDSDVIVTNYYNALDEKTLNKVNVLESNERIILDISEFKPQNPIGMWALIYKTEVLRKSKLHLPERTPYTDQLYSLIPFAVSKTIELYPVYLYCYRIGYEEQSASKTSRIRNMDKMLNICKLTSKFAEDNKSNVNYNYLLWRASIYHTVGIRTILLGKINNKHQRLLKSYEKDIKKEAPSVYKEAVHRGKIGKLIGLFRKTNYISYWLLKLLPKGISNWQ